MLGTLVRHEIRQHLTSLRFAVLVAISLLLVATNALTFSSWYRSALNGYSERVEGLTDDLDRTSLVDIPCQQYGLGSRPSALAFVAGSAARELPDRASASVSAVQSVFRQGRIEDLLAAAPVVDWVFVIATVLTFAAGVLTYRTVAGELHDGTLSLVLANRVPRGTLLLSKYLGALAALAAAWLLAATFGLLGVLALSPVRFTVAEWVQLTGVGLAGLLLLSCFALLGLLLSVVSRNATIAATAFLLSWAFLVFIVPGLGGVAAEQSATGRQARLWGAGSRAALAERYPYPDNADAATLASVDREREEAGERAFVEYLGELARQVRVGQRISRLSPAATFGYAVEGLTGQGLWRLERFVANALRFRRGLLEAALAADAQDPQSRHLFRPGECGVGDHFSRRTVDLGPAKHFADRPATPAEGLRAAAGDIALLLLDNGLLFLLALWRFVRQDVAPTSTL
ncbi:MAG: ABC transporter permease subunit [Candidatus Latescibacterota bacterium]